MSRGSSHCTPRSVMLSENGEVEPTSPLAGREAAGHRPRVLEHQILSPPVPRCQRIGELAANAVVDQPPIDEAAVLDASQQQAPRLAPPAAAALVPSKVANG
jgi:hypothetical protein